MKVKVVNDVNSTFLQNGEIYEILKIISCDDRMCSTYEPDYSSHQQCKKILYSIGFAQTYFYYCSMRFKMLTFENYGKEDNES